jgi:probable HAF family extracellular repeat protein
VTDLGSLIGRNDSFAVAINNSGHVVGTSYNNEANSNRAIFWNGTELIDLNSFLDSSTVDAGWVLLRATDINDYGWIVGQASNSLLGISERAFLLAPVPEPETFTMFIEGLGLLGFMRLHRKNKLD